ncbi:MAG TPA: type II CAAX endopeptidase family protein [Methylomirabilota bacterium]
METASSLPDEPRASPPEARAPASPSRRWSAVVTALSAVILALFLLFIAWLMFAEPRVAGYRDADRALALVVGRTLDVHDALQGAPRWERRLYEVTALEGGNDLRQALDWYEELARYSVDPLVDLHLAILQSEAGQLDRVDRATAEWRQREDPLPAFADLLAVAYLDPREAGDAVDVSVLQTVGAEWFRDRVFNALARRSGDEAAVAAVARETAARSGRLLFRVRALTVAQLALLAGGLAALGIVVRRRRDLTVGPAPLPPPWTFRAGVVTLIRGGAGAALVTAGLLFVYPGSDAIGDALTVPATYLPFVPLLVLARRRLVRPARLGVADAFGLRPYPRRGFVLVLMAGALTAAGMIGEWALGQLGDREGFGTHWTEWFDHDLVWGTLPITIVTVVGAVVLAPVVEEVVFRGLIFGTLRRRLPAGLAAVVSATLFAIPHGYGVLGFAAVFWSGFLWAYAYEKTGSLLPGMAAHALNNAAASLTVLALLRG